MSILGSRFVAHHSTMRVRPRRPLPVWLQILLAALSGLALRLFLVLLFPADAGDSPVYQELARNWLGAHVYGLFTANGLVPSDVRPPGYPAFLVLVYIVIGRGERVILLAQALLDLCTCFLVAWLASRFAPEPHRRRITMAALWLAVLCPFVADYAAVPLTEVLATFLTAAALVPMAVGCVALNQLDTKAARGQLTWKPWFTGGLLAGLGTLVRPETPLLLIALVIVLLLRWWRRADWGKLISAVAFASLGLVLPLLPWGARNAMRFHEVQFLSPRYAATPDEYTPRGLYAWTATWLVRFRDVYLVPWNIGSSPVSLDDIPPSAFDSPDERARVAALLDQYNATLKMTPQIDRGFAELGRERTARHPFRTYLFVPVERAATMWLTPRVDLLPFSGHLWPIRQQWHRDRTDVCVTVLLGSLNVFYVGLAAVGLRRALHRRESATQGLRWALALFVVFILVRTAFLTTVETPEPRYVLECFPAIFALGSLAWLPLSG